MPKNNVPIVMYHAINDRLEDSPVGFLCFTPAEFSRQLRCFTRAGFQCVTLSELWEIAAAGDWGRRRLAALTFDDGYLDNYLVAAEILEQHGAKGTIFANPAYATSGPARTATDVPNAWGLLNFEEMRRLEQDGVVEIQSHTMSHQNIFCSDRIIDLYTPDKFDQYFWLAWMTHPETQSQWHGDVRRFAGWIPTGYPIFEFGRALGHKQFHPKPEFVEQCCQAFAQQGITCLETVAEISDKGCFESEEQYYARVDYELGESKSILERELSHPVDFVCFPGGATNAFVQERAAHFGYRAYMLSSRDQYGNNIEALGRAKTFTAGDPPIGLKRISFTKRFPRFLRGPRAAYWVTRLKIGAFMGEPIPKLLTKIAKIVRFLTGFRHRQKNKKLPPMDFQSDILSRFRDDIPM